MHTGSRGLRSSSTATFWSLAVAGTIVLLACSDTTSAPAAPPDGDDDDTVEPVGERDSGARDSGPGAGQDGGTKDAGPDATSPDAAASDAGTITEILGTLTGVCPALDALLASPAPGLVGNRVDFVAGETFSRDALSAGGQHLYDTPNAGGSSSESEIVAFEVLHHCDGAALYKTETEVQYATQGKKTDLVVDFGARRIGVSVVRAVGYPCGTQLTDAAARTLIEGKLSDILQSTQNVAPADRWERQILHVISATPENTEAVRRAAAAIDAATRADTLLVVTETDGAGFLYYDPEIPLGTECPVD